MLLQVIGGSAVYNLEAAVDQATAQPEIAIPLLHFAQRSYILVTKAKLCHELRIAVLTPSSSKRQAPPSFKLLPSLGRRSWTRVSNRQRWIRSHESRSKPIHPHPRTKPVVPSWNCGRPHGCLGHDPLPQAPNRLRATTSLPNRSVWYGSSISNLRSGPLTTQCTDPLSDALLASATAPSATTKHKTLELYNPSNVVELKYTGTLTFRWAFKWET